MARKKTTSAKKRTNPPAATAAATAGWTTPPKGVANAATMFPGDRVNELFLDNGKHIGVVRVVKYMPHAVQQLKKGTLSPDQFGENVAAAFQEHFRLSTGFLFTFDILILSICQEFCWPGPVNTTAINKTELRFVKSMAASFREEYDEFKDLQGNAFCSAAIEALQSSLKETCRTLSAQMNREYFNDKKGAFLRWCPLYGILSAKEFTRIVEKWSCLDNLREQLTKARDAKRIFDRVQRDALLAGFSVVQKVDEAWEECWECGKKGKTIPHCSRCAVAQYCGPDCQVKAWGRHEKVCTKSNNLHELLQENLCIVREAHKSGRIHGVNLNFAQDCGTAQLIMRASITRDSGFPADGPRCVCVFRLVRKPVRITYPAMVSLAD